MTSTVHRIKLITSIWKIFLTTANSSSF